MFATVIALLLLLALAFQAVHLWLLAGAHGPAVATLPAPVQNPVPVSVVICAKNESAQLAVRLPAVLEQHYHHNGVPAYEVLVADDASTDDTKAVVARLQRQYPHLRYLFVQQEPKVFRGKKGALKTAVGAAQNNTLLFTDADCLPAGPLWIAHMLEAKTGGKKMVAGYAPYEEKWGFLNAFIRAEALLSFMHIAALHRRGIPYAATGRNLLVEKETFEKAVAGPRWIKTLSGDDDMLVQEAATGTNFAVQPLAAAAMHSPAKATLRAYIAQKQRHMSTGKYYRLPVKVLFFLLNGSSFLFWAVLPPAVGVLLTGGAPLLLKAALVAALLRLLIFALLLFRYARRQHTRLSFGFLMLFDAATALHSLFFAPYIFWKNKTTWK